MNFFKESEISEQVIHRYVFESRHLVLKQDIQTKSIKGFQYKFICF